jgi:hypothetical protein
VDAARADALEATRRQLLVFADDLQTIVVRERERPQEAEQAYRLFDTQTTGKGVFVF